jgi:hypothetical protein
MIGNIPTYALHVAATVLKGALTVGAAWLLHMVLR